MSDAYHKRIYENGFALDDDRHKNLSGGNCFDELLNHIHDMRTTKGKVMYKQALEKAHEEFERYKKPQESLLSPRGCHFLESIDELYKLENKH